MPEDIALFIDFENIRYSMLNIQRREPDPQELIAVARRYGTVMVARAYADWSRQPEPFKGSLTAAMIDRVDCPAKQRDRIRMGTVHYPSGNTPTGALGNTAYPGEQGIASLPPSRPWSSGNTGSLPAITPATPGNGWSYQEPPLPLENELDETFRPRKIYHLKRGMRRTTISNERVYSRAHHTLQCYLTHNPMVNLLLPAHWGRAVLAPWDTRIVPMLATLVTYPPSTLTTPVITPLCKAPSYKVPLT